MDKELPIDISTWDEQCMRRFIQQNAPLFHVFARRYVDDAQTIDDFLQEAYIKLWTNRKRIGKVSSVNNYFYTILRNVILDNWSYISHSGGLDDEAYLDISSNETFIRHIIEAESSRLIAEAIGKLSPQSRKVIGLTLEGKTMPEIAEALQLSVNTVKTVKYRAVERLSELLSKEDFFTFLLFFSLLSVK